MKITDVGITVTNPGGWNFVLVKITTDEGLHGWGDASLAGREHAVVETLRTFSPLLLGRDPSQMEDIWQSLYRSGYWKGGSTAMSAIAGIDMALWDLKGKVSGLPVYDLLGGRSRAGALAYTHAGGRDVQEVEDGVRAALERGFKVVRVQIGVPGLRNTYGAGSEGASPAHLGGWDPASLPPLLETFEPQPYLRAVPALFDHLRSVFGADVELCHDTHERLSPIEAARLVRDLEPYKPFFVEDLLRPEHAESFRLIRQASTVPLAMGELYTGKWECLPVISGQLIDYIRCDLAHTGGITEARKIATVAELYAVRTAWHGPADISPITHAANVHLDLAVTNFGVQEWSMHADPVREVIRGGPTCSDGYLDVRSDPGLGVDVDETAAGRFPYRPVALPMARRLDGSIHDW